MVKALRRLDKRQEREKGSLVLLEGLRLVSDALDAGCTPDCVLVTADTFEQHAGLRARLEALPSGVVHLATPDAIAAACTTVSPQTIVASAPRPAAPPLECLLATPRPVLVLDGVADPGNVGTLVRGAAAFDCGGVVCLGACADPWSPKALRSAMGAAFRVPLAAAAGWEALREAMAAAGLSVYAADGRAEAVAHYAVDWTHPCALVVGNEANGLSVAVREGMAAGQVAAVSIPMAAGVESLNAAMAGSIILAEAHRQRCADPRA